MTFFLFRVYFTRLWLYFYVQAKKKRKKCKSGTGKRALSAPRMNSSLLLSSSSSSFNDILDTSGKLFASAAAGVAAMLLLHDLLAPSRFPIESTAERFRASFHFGFFGEHLSATLFVCFFLLLENNCCVAGKQSSPSSSSSPSPEPKRPKWKSVCKNCRTSVRAIVLTDLLPFTSIPTTWNVFLFLVQVMQHATKQYHFASRIQTTICCN